MHLCKYDWQIWLHTNISSLNRIGCLLFWNSRFPRWILVMIYKLSFHKFKENCVPRKCLDAVLIAVKFHFLMLSRFKKINFCSFFISIVHLKVRLIMLNPFWPQLMLNKCLHFKELHIYAYIRRVRSHERQN